LNAPGLIVVLIVAGLLVGGVVAFGAPIFAIPIVLLFGAGAFALTFMRRTREQRDVQEFRRQAQAGTEFTARDRETQTDV
jgi:Flp pilus assembly protein TadB